MAELACELERVFEAGCSKEALMKIVDLMTFFLLFSRSIEEASNPRICLQGINPFIQIKYSILNYLRYEVGKKVKGVKKMNKV